MKIYAKCILESCTTDWFAGQRTAEATINVTDFTAGSDVILAINIDKASDGKIDDVAIDKITLVGNTSDTDILGKCGENATYTLTSDGTLTISGTGEITGANFSSKDIKTVIINSGITSIGDYAFYMCSNLTNVTIPDSVKNIGNDAFEYCDELTSVTIPNSVTSIGDYAFYGCNNLTNIAIPNGVTSVGSSAFSWCSNLINIIIPDSVTCIGGSAFSGCSSLTNITIPDSVTSIGNSAFLRCENLTSITIPDSVISIGGGAFASTNLTSVTIPDSVTSIGNSAFSGCSNLNYTTYDNGKYLGNESNPYHAFIETTSSNIASCEIHKNTRIIAGLAFYNCSNLTNITIPDSVTSVGDYAFANCTNLTNITIPDSVTNIGNYAFSGCSNLTSISIPDSVTSVGDFAFISCHNLNYATYDNGKYLGNEDNRYVILMDTTSSDITSCVIHNKTKIIHYGAFRYCSGLTSIMIPNNIASIGNEAFKGCRNLTSITIPDSVTSIGDQAFLSCDNLTSVTISSSVTNIGNYAFCGDALTSINVSKDNECYKSIDGNLYSKNGKTLIEYASGKKDISFVISDSVTSIGDYAFYGCRGLTSITIPNSVTSIGSFAFMGCTNLTSITIPNSVTKIKSRTFTYCDSMTSVTIPDSVTSISTDAFEGCSSLTNINVSKDNECYKSIDGNLYSKDGKTLIQYAIGKSNTSFSIPDGVMSIDESAFYWCKNLTSIVISDSVTSIDKSAFYWCKNLTSIVIPDSVTSIAYNAFEYCNDDLVIVCERDSYAESYATNNDIGVEYINVPKALGGQIKTTAPAGLRLGFSTENFNKTPTKLQIMVKKEDGEWKTVDVVKFYNEEKTIFTVYITNIPDSAKDVKFTAKAVATFEDGTVRESDEITRSYNEVLQNLENAENA